MYDIKEKFKKFESMTAKHVLQKNYMILRIIEIKDTSNINLGLFWLFDRVANFGKFAEDSEDFAGGESLKEKATLMEHRLGAKCAECTQLERSKVSNTKKWGKVLKKSANMK